jgi:tetrahedral aminopeptidase
VIDLIRKLTEAWGPSGYEHQVRELIREEVKPYADKIEVDPLGSLICHVGKKGKSKKTIMVAAHMDEIGVMASFQEPKSGYLRFNAIGGLLYTTLHGSRVRFEDGTIGVIAAPEPFGAARTTAPELDSFFIDVGDGNETTTVKAGSPASFWRPFEQRGHRLIAKSMDDRIGCVIAIEAMRRLAGNTPHKVCFAFTVQEEVGLRGARPAAHGIDPDVGISLDVTQTGDEVKGERHNVRLGSGAAIKIMDTGHVVPPHIRDWMIGAAEAGNIPYQREMLTLGTTDAAGIQVARAGVPSGCISIPCRFVHTTSETVDIRDVEACVQLLVKLLSEPLPFT